AVPATVNAAVTALIFLGGTVFFVGVLYPAVVNRWVSLGRWHRHWRAYRALHPLWSALHEAFPSDVLDRGPRTWWRDRLSVRHMHRRYWRRVIEIRDGLV